MTASINLTLRSGPGALIRVLGLAERRGYDPISVTAEPIDSSTLTLQLIVKANRPINLLLRRLNKLYDVQSIEVL